MKNSALLSLCIPTYNRPTEFKRMMSGILSQLNSINPQDIEIIVRDDSTNLNTQEIFYQLVDGKDICFKYHKGEKIGLDAANIFLVEKSTGKFCWWLSDDDELYPGALEKVISTLRHDQNITYIWLNFDFSVSGNIAIKKNSNFFRDRNDILETLGTNIGLLTTHVFHREIALSGLEEAKKYLYGFAFAGLAVLMKVYITPGKYYFLSGPCILCHPTTREEVKSIVFRTGELKNEAFEVYGIMFYKVITAFKGYFSRRAVRKILSANFSSLWRGMLIGWIGGWDSPEGKKIKMFQLYWSYPECWLALIAFNSPLWLNSALYTIYKLFFHERKFLGFSQIVKKCSWSNNE